jgi:NAD(P)-dependent dehydrogenase (short-subunit alcohol dehydrogenase family)
MKNFLVIGASSGIGEALAHTLSASGHQVFGTYNQNPVEGANFFALNVLDEVLNFDFLPEQLDGLAYCPGAIQLRPFHRIKLDKFRQDFDLQVGGAIKVIQGVLPRLKKAENASIVLFSTVAVQQGFNFHSQVAVSKGALEGLTRSLAAEFAPKIRVNCVAPSLTHTPLADKLLNSEEKIAANAQRHPLKRIGAAGDIAQAAAFLLTAQSSWMSGQVLAVDGGMSSLRV